MTNPMTDKALVDHMAQRFLGWRLPDNFNPDAGISFQPDYNVGSQWPGKHKPTGTNLIGADEAKDMVRYMLEGAPLAALQPTYPKETSDYLTKEDKKELIRALRYASESSYFKKSILDVAMAMFSEDIPKEKE